jgi:phosphoribosylformylglycinamidine synthase II
MMTRHVFLARSLLVNFLNSVKNPRSMPDPVVTPELVSKHGLTPDEFSRIKSILGREPNFTELGIFSVMWSEHCSYKNSRLELRKFPTTGPRVLVKAGEENAGVVDIGDGWGVAFKMESHNHPSAVEPFQGAATGVGGILRDIFTMGARPVFLMNSLRFGDIRPGAPNAATNRRLLAGVVSGIAHYGNCIGVPTVGGEVYFDASYDGNPLVNVFCLGTLRTTEIRRGAATGTGNPVFYVGNRTGRDGLAGAAFASRDLTEDSKADRPAVQVGDPFIEKLLLEACLELFQHPEAVVGVQDMGAAGLTCSTCETASRGGTGIEIDLALVPQREPGMTPYETMLSESQERMLIIVRAGHEKTVTDIFEKWDLPCARIGHVTDDGLMRVKDHGVTVAEIPARQLADEAPLYKREARRPADLDARQKLDLAAVPEPADLAAVLPRLLATPDLASKRWIYRQYDHMVQVGTVTGPGSDAAVVRIATGDSWKYLAASVDCNAHYVALEPKLGALIAVAECARNLAMTGAEPLALTDNLNFGNPHNPENFYQLQQAVDGLAEGCRAFDIPVTGGNVSLYNQSPAGAIDPTPTVGIVGIIRDAKDITPSHFQKAGDVIVLIGGPADGSKGNGIGEELGASLYLREIHGLKRGRPPELDLEREKKMHAAVLAAIRAGHVRSAHDLAEGGLLVALAECAIGGAQRLGASVALDLPHQRVDGMLFGETQSRALLTAAPDGVDALLALVESHGVPVRKIGFVDGEALAVKVAGSSPRELSWPVVELHRAWDESLASYLNM